MGNASTLNRFRYDGVLLLEKVGDLFNYAENNTPACHGQTRDPVTLERHLIRGEVFVFATRQILEQ